MRYPGQIHLLIAGLLWSQAIAAADGVPRAAGPGRVVDAPDGKSQMEQISLDSGIGSALLGVLPEGSVTIADWPVAPGVRQTVVVTRHEIYAPDARIVAIDAGREIEVPRSRLVFLWGSATGDDAASILIVVDPDSGVVSGSSMSSIGNHDLLPPEAGRTEQLLVREGALRKDAAEGGFSCGLESLPSDLQRERERAKRLASAGQKALASLHSAVIAVDTDNEFMGTKFGNNTTNATNYIAQLTAGVNAIYERDLLVRMHQGYTILRLSTTPDPYLVSTTGSADSAKLNEVSNVWNSNFNGIKRTLVVMLSGKQASGGWSGIAWIGGLCSGYYGVSFNQVFRTGTTAGTSDFQLVGHEVGHNFGSPHTHCADTNSAMSGTQPIDFCNTTQCGAAWNPPAGAVCPTAFTVTPVNGAPVTNVRGTLMSYCHQLSGCGVTNVFHPLSISLAIGPDIDAAVGQCIFPQTGNPAPTVTSVTPASGLASGGTAVTITGSNFRSPASVAFTDLAGGKAATAVTVVNSTRITVLTPAHSAGLTDVVVQNSDGAPATLRNAYTYIPVLTVTSISPNSGATSGGTPVTITGTGFVAPASVSLGGTAATGVSVVNGATHHGHDSGSRGWNSGRGRAEQRSDSDSWRRLLVPRPSSGREFFSLPPCRLVDTRTAAGPLGGPALAASGSRQFALASVCGIPAGATAVSVNVTITQAAASGFLALFPGDGLASTSSTINFSSGQTRANNAVALLSSGGTRVLGVRNGSAGIVHLILDVNGYFQ